MAANCLSAPRRRPRPRPTSARSPRAAGLDSGLTRVPCGRPAHILRRPDGRTRSPPCCATRPFPPPADATTATTSPPADVRRESPAADARSTASAAARAFRRPGVSAPDGKRAYDLDHRRLDLSNGGSLDLFNIPRLPYRSLIIGNVNAVGDPPAHRQQESKRWNPDVTRSMQPIGVPVPDWKGAQAPGREPLVGPLLPDRTGGRRAPCRRSLRRVQLGRRRPRLDLSGSRAVREPRGVSRASDAQRPRRPIRCTTR